MTPKDKAEQLIGKMCLDDFTDENIEQCKQCALIAVDEMIVLTGEIAHTADEYYLKRNELLEIKQEIEKL